MSEDIIAIAFDPLTQGDMSGTRQFGGLGNGLALVKMLCAQLGGTVVVRSGPDSGSCFSLALPVGFHP
jgi:signal transduction histidine kinase